MEVPLVVESIEHKDLEGFEVEAVVATIRGIEVIVECYSSCMVNIFEVASTASVVDKSTTVAFLVKVSLLVIHKALLSYSVKVALTVLLEYRPSHKKIMFAFRCLPSMIIILFIYSF